MSILSAKTIRSLGLILPLHERRVHAPSGMSAGLSVSGVDITLKQDLIMWPGRFVLASAMEHFKLPNNVVAEVKDKSSHARRGLSVFNTFCEAGWEGYLTLELKNQSWKWFRLHAGQPIAQVVFSFTDEPTEGYSGKYQNQPDRPVKAIREK